MKEKLVKWIEEYKNSNYAYAVMHRKWGTQLIHSLYREMYPGYTESASSRWIMAVNERMDDLIQSTSFEELHQSIKAIRVHGIKDLTQYDTATMIGCPLGIYPEFVYLHAGTADGARALGVVGETATKEQFTNICDAFEQLEPIQIEDFLCIYKNQLLGNNNSSPLNCNSCC